MQLLIDAGTARDLFGREKYGTPLPDHVIDWIDAGLKGQQLVPAAEAVTITRSVPHGHVAAVLGTAPFVAKKALETFGTPELRTLLNESGMGNNPEVIRAFYRVGKAISEDKFVSGKATPADANDARSLYPNSNLK